MTGFLPLAAAAVSLPGRGGGAAPGAVLGLSLAAGWVIIAALVVPFLVIVVWVILRGVVKASARWADEARTERRPGGPPWPPPSTGGQP